MQKPETPKKKKFDRFLLKLGRMGTHKKGTSSNSKKAPQTNNFFKDKDFSFMENIEKLLSKNQKLGTDSLGTLPDMSASHWTDMIKDKKKAVEHQIQKFFREKKQGKVERGIRRGRLGGLEEIKVGFSGKSGASNSGQKTPKNFSSKKIQLRISKSNNINKKHCQESLEQGKKIDFSVLESGRKKNFRSSSKKKGTRMKSELPGLSQKIQRVEKEFSRRFSNCLPFPQKLYKLLAILGKGSYGLVFLAVHLISGQKVAIKAIRKNRNNDLSRNYEKITNEINIMSKLNHKNITRLFEVFENPKYIFLVTEFADKGTTRANLRRLVVSFAEKWPLFRVPNLHRDQGFGERARVFAQEKGAASRHQVGQHFAGQKQQSQVMRFRHFAADQ